MSGPIGVFLGTGIYYSFPFSFTFLNLSVNCNNLTGYITASFIKTFISEQLYPSILLAN